MSPIEIQYFQRGFNYSQDGPGNRLVYHLQGCNMHCPWCSNPEGMAAGPAPFCKPVEAVAAEIVSCRPMFFDGGGVTFTGGEATLQLEPLKALLRAVRAQKIHVALETNGTHPRLTGLLGLADYWMIDLKHPDSERLRRVTGVGCEEVGRNIAAIAQRETVHLRIPLIHGFNDDAAAFDQFLHFLCELKHQNARFDVEILPYHEYGKEKWKSAGRPYTVTDGFVTNETVARLEALLRENLIRVIHT